MPAVTNPTREMTHWIPVLVYMQLQKDTRSVTKSGYNTFENIS